LNDDEKPSHHQNALVSNQRAQVALNHEEYLTHDEDTPGVA